MPVEVLRPNLVQESGAAGDVITAPSSPTLVGDPNTLWRDGSTATYVDSTQDWTVSSSFSVTSTRQDSARAPLDVLGVDSTQATLNSILVEIDGEQLGSTSPDSTSGGGTLVVSLFDPTTYDSFYGYTTLWRTASLLNNVNDGSLLYLPGDWGNFFEHPATGVNFSSAEVLDFFASGRATVRATAGDVSNTPGSWTASGRFYDIAVTVDYTLIHRNPPRLRQYPRTNRLYPPPPNRRQAGGYR